MRRVPPYLALVLLALLPSCDIPAADYAEGLAPPGVPASAFPAPNRPVARIVTDTWHDEQSRDKVGEAERVMNLLSVKPGLTVADIGAGSGYYTVRLARRVAPTGHVYAEDVVPDYLERLAQRVRSEGTRTTRACRPALSTSPSSSTCTTKPSSPTACYGTCVRR